MLRFAHWALLWLSAVAIVCGARTREANAGCTPAPPYTGVGEVVTCNAATPPNPEGALNFAGGGDRLTVNSGAYGAFTFPSGNNSLIFGLGGGAPVVAGTVVFGPGADRMEVHSGTITGNINQGTGVDTFIMTGGLVGGNVDQSDQLDTAVISGGTIVGTMVNGDFVTVTGGRIGAVDLNVANNVFTMSGGAIVGNVTAEQNNDTFTLTGGSIGGVVDLGSGTDAFTWSGGGTIAGAITLGAGNDTAILRNLTAANLIMPLMDGSSGTDQLTFDNVVTAGVSRFVNWETIGLTNGTQLTLDANLILGDSGTGTGTLSIDARSTLFAGGGVNPSILPFTAGSLVTVTNAGLIDLTNGGSGATDTLTIAGKYVGAGGRLALQTVLGADNSPSDKLVISGAGATAGGSTSIAITNVGGSGALTVVDGIQVVQAADGATTQGGAFSLAGPVAAGPFEYLLFKGGVTAGSQDNWYLRSTLPPTSPVVPPPTPAPGTPALPPPPEPGAAPVPLFRPEVAVHAAVPGLARAVGLATLGTYHERMGVENPTSGWRSWGRLLGQHSDLGFSGTVRPDFNGTIGGFQAGSDVWTFASAGHRDHFGLYGAFAQAFGDVRGFVIGLEGAPAGRVSLDGTSLGGYWTHIGPTGWYLDTVLQGTWLDGNPRSHRGIRADASGEAFAASVEGGYPLPIWYGLVFEPQAQAIWQHLSLDDTADRFSTIGFDNDDAFTGRVGARLQARFATPEAVWLPYLKTNVWWNSGASDTLLFAAFPIAAGSRSTALELGGGLTAKLGPSVSLYSEASYLWSIDGQDVDTSKGTVGLRVTW